MTQLRCGGVRIAPSGAGVGGRGGGAGALRINEISNFCRGKETGAKISTPPALGGTRCQQKQYQHFIYSCTLIDVLVVEDITSPIYNIYSPWPPVATRPATKTNLHRHIR